MTQPVKFLTNETPFHVFSSQHWAGLKIGGRTVASGELKLTRATKS